MSDMDGFVMAPIDNFSRTKEACIAIIADLMGSDFKVTHMSVGKVDGQTRALIFHPGDPSPHMAAQLLPMQGGVAATSGHLIKRLDTLEIDKPPVVNCVKGWVFSVLELGDIKSLRAEVKYALTAVTGSVN